MKSRMIHHLDGRLDSQAYDPFEGQSGYSLSRPTLNQRLLEALPPEITCRFNTKLAKIDFRRRRAFGISIAKKVLPGQEDDDGAIAGDRKVREYQGDVEDRDGTDFDVILGCDGTWSKVRTEMMRAQRCVQSTSSDYG